MLCEAGWTPARVCAESIEARCVLSTLALSKPKKAFPDGKAFFGLLRRDGKNKNPIPMDINFNKNEDYNKLLVSGLRKKFAKV